MKTVFGSRRSGKSVKVLSELITFKLKNPKEKAVVLSKDGLMVWNDKFTWLNFENPINHYAGDVSMNFTMKYVPEVHFDPIGIPEPISFDGQPKCPICGFPVSNKVGLEVIGGTSKTKNYCILCGHNWGPGE